MPDSLSATELSSFLPFGPELEGILADFLKDSDYLGSDYS